MDYKKYGLKFYTKTIITEVKGIKIPKMLGVIEGPVNKMIKAYPDEFSFMRHQTMRDQRPSKEGTNAISKKSQSYRKVSTKCCLTKDNRFISLLEEEGY